MNPYYVHITSWTNNDSSYYRYGGHNIGGCVVSESIDDILHALITTESYRGYCAKSEKLVKVNELQLESFKKIIKGFEVEDSNTYQLEQLLEASETHLTGYNQGFRYRRSIHFCEQLSTSSSRIDEQVKLIESNIIQLSETHKRLSNLLDEDVDLEDTIISMSEIKTASKNQEYLLDECLENLKQIKETQKLIGGQSARNLERILGSQGYKAPLLRFDINSIT